MISVLEVSRDLESESECVPRMISITLNNLWATKGFPSLPSGYIISFSLASLYLVKKEATLSSKTVLLIAIPCMLSLVFEKGTSSHRTLKKHVCP
jgi:hypothetical protein